MSKENHANAYAEHFFEIQKLKWKSDKSRRIYGVTLTIILSSIIITLGCSVWIFQKSVFSENENRILTPMPELHADELVNGKFTKNLSDFISDSFPFREKFIELRSNAEKIMQKKEVNGVLVGKNGVLAERPAFSKENRVRLTETEHAINTISENLKKIGIKSYVAVAPFAAEMHKDSLPSLFSCKDALDFSIDTDNTVYLRDTLDGQPDIWFKTDHHWTANGAYLAYVALGSTLGYTPYSEESFTKETVSENFYGTAYSKSGLYSTPPDSITLLRYSGDGEFYDMSALENKDKYAVFLGGNHSRLTIEKHTDKPRMLLIKDSYANALVPFLALHFNLEIIDPRYFSGDIYEISERCDVALFLYGASSLLTDTDLVRMTLN